GTPGRGGELAGVVVAAGLGLPGDRVGVGLELAADRVGEGGGPGRVGAGGEAAVGVVGGAGGAARSGGGDEETAIVVAVGVVRGRRGQGGDTAVEVVTERLVGVRGSATAAGDGGGPVDLVVGDGLGDAAGFVDFDGVEVGVVLVGGGPVTGVGVGGRGRVDDGFEVAEAVVGLDRRVGVRVGGAGAVAGLVVAERRGDRVGGVDGFDHGRHPVERIERTRGRVATAVGDRRRVAIVVEHRALLGQQDTGVVVAGDLIEPIAGVVTEGGVPAERVGDPGRASESVPGGGGGLGQLVDRG